MTRPAPRHATTLLLDALAHDRWEDNPPAPPSRLEDMCRDCLERMRMRDRDLLLEKYYEQLTYREIAERHGWPHKGSAHWYTRRALDELRRRIERRLAHDKQED